MNVSLPTPAQSQCFQIGIRGEPHLGLDEGEVVFNVATINGRRMILSACFAFLRSTEAPAGAGARESWVLDRGQIEVVTDDAGRIATVDMNCHVSGPMFVPEALALHEKRRAQTGEIDLLSAVATTMRYWASLERFLATDSPAIDSVGQSLGSRKYAELVGMDQPVW